MPKLPADLPEDWTRGQIVSPNGTETGLTEQHGYNYLMKQVNATQTEVNGINEALPDVAQQATVEEINNKIGTESDADTQPTLFGRLAQMKNVLVKKLAEVLTKVTGIDGKIGTSESTIFEELSTIKENTDSSLIYTPSTNIRKTIVNKEISLLNNSLDQRSYATCFLGYFFAKRDGFVKISMTTKRDMSSGPSADVYVTANKKMYAGDVTNFFPIIMEQSSLPQQGDIQRDVLQRVSAQINSGMSTSYKKEEVVMSVVKDTLYLFSIQIGYDNNTTYINNLTVSYDETEGDAL